MTDRKPWAAFQASYDAVRAMDSDAADVVRVVTEAAEDELPTALEVMHAAGDNCLEITVPADRSVDGRLERNVS